MKIRNILTTGATIAGIATLINITSVTKSKTEEVISNNESEVTIEKTGENIFSFDFEKEIKEVTELIYYGEKIRELNLVIFASKECFFNYEPYDLNGYRKYILYCSRPAINNHLKGIAFESMEDLYNYTLKLTKKYNLI